MRRQPKMLQVPLGQAIISRRASGPPLTRSSRNFNSPGDLQEGNREELVAGRRKIATPRSGRSNSWPDLGVAIFRRPATNSSRFPSCKSPGLLKLRLDLVKGGPLALLEIIACPSGTWSIFG